MTLIAGLFAAALLWWFLKSFARANPTKLAVLLRRAGGAAAFLLALVLLLRGRIDMAMLAAGAGAWLLDWTGLSIPGFRRAGAARPGSVSRVRSAMVEMELDHDTGRMRGTVLAGGFTGRVLDDLGPEDLQHLGEECRAADPDGYRLLEAYLDRRFAGRREHAERHRDAGPRPDLQRGAMTEQEAYEILGLEPGAQPEAVRRAHRNLMKKLHPDQGGSTYLASRVNQAKDVLLNRHR
jgi:hypothetical protein